MKLSIPLVIGFALASAASGAETRPTCLATDDDMATVVAKHGLQPGMHVLLLGYWPARDLADWQRPPMDSNSDWLSVDGAR